MSQPYHPSPMPAGPGFPPGFWRNPLHILAFGLGSGLSPKAPGTAGTLVAMVLYAGLQYLPWVWLLIWVLVAMVAGIAICGRTSDVLGVKDHSGIVWDEFVGYWLAMLMAPAGWIWLLVGFVLFRVFDIWKPWPVSWADQHLEGGLGIMLDDVLAGLYAGVLMALAGWFGF